MEKDIRGICREYKNKKGEKPWRKIYEQKGP